MTVFLSAHFDGATSGTITPANEPGISAVSGTNPSFSGGDAYTGAAAGLTAASSVSLVHQILPTPATTLYWHGYFKMTGTNSSAIAIVAVRDGSSNVCASIAINVSGNIVLRDGTTNQMLSTYAMTTSNGWVRFEWFVDRGGANTQTLELYYGTNVEGNVPNETLTAPCTSATSPLYRIICGTVSANAGAQFAFDELVLADAEVGAITPPAYTVTVWDGTAEVATSSVAVWDGTSEVAANLFGTEPS